MLFINPDDRRQPQRRQVSTRQHIDQLLQEMARRKSMSRFAGMGQSRMPRSRRPFRGAAAGMRQFIGGRPSRLGGIVQLLQDRFPGLPPQAKRVVPYEPDTRIADAMGAQPLPFPDISKPAESGFVTTAADSGAYPDSGVTTMAGSGLGPDTGVISMADSGFGGLVPLGGGSWFDPVTGMIHGPSRWSGR